MPLPVKSAVPTSKVARWKLAYQRAQASNLTCHRRRNSLLFWAERDPNAVGSTTRGRIMQSTIRNFTNKANSRSIITLDADAFATELPMINPGLTDITAENHRDTSVGTVHRTHHLVSCTGGDITGNSSRGPIWPTVYSFTTATITGTSLPPTSTTFTSR